MPRRLYSVIVLVLMAVVVTACGSPDPPVVSHISPCEVEPGGSASFNVTSSYKSGTIFEWSTTYGRVSPENSTTTLLELPRDADPGRDFIVEVTQTLRGTSISTAVDCFVAGESVVAANESTDDGNDVPGGDEETGGDTQPEAVRGSDPVGDSDVWINSHPSGASVYIVPADVEVYDLELDDVMTPVNLFGQTPLTQALSPGNYYVVVNFPAALFEAEGVTLPGYSDPTYDFAFPFDGNVSSSMTFSGGEEIAGITRIYRLSKSAGRSAALVSISLPLPESERSQSLPSIYPTLATVASLSADYYLEADVMRNSIKDDLQEHGLNEVDDAMVDEMVEVLQRAGKVKLNTDTVDLIIQLGGFDSSTFIVSAYQ